VMHDQLHAEVSPGACSQVPKQCDEAPKHFLAEELAAKKAGGTA
jgi:hypothetical protein